jgi:hypothetical protein
LEINSGRANENFWPGVNGPTGTSISSGTYDGISGVRSNGGIGARGGYPGYTVDSGYMSIRFNETVQYPGTTTYSNTSASQYFAIRGVRDSGL